ncbi:DUF5667 domain-containing protein [Chloroflexota bacterium]
MKKLRLILLTAVLATSLLISGTVYAQEEELQLPNPGITPDSPLYFFDTLGKNIGLFLTAGPEAKAKKALGYAEERLAEVKVMAIKNKAKGVQRAALDYYKFVAIVVEKNGEVAQPEISDNVSERVALATSKHLAVLDGVREAIPEQAKEALDRAREASLNGQKNALRALAKRKTERAIEINMATIEGRLSRARVKATDNATEEVQEAIDDMDKLLEIEGEISEIAQELGRDTTIIEQRVARATANRLEVLARVYEKVPDQAKSAIEGAMANSIRKHERVTEALEKKNALGEISKQAPLPEVIRGEVRERIMRLRPEIIEETSIQKGAQEKTRERTESRPPTGTSANSTGQKRIQEETRERTESGPPAGTSVNNTEKEQKERSLRQSND